LGFNYGTASDRRTARNAWDERAGVCRDFAHLAITLCRAVNIPARYCTGYLVDFAGGAFHGLMDFSAWFEVYLGGRWYPFDARHNHIRYPHMRYGPPEDGARPRCDGRGAHDQLRPRAAHAIRGAYQ
jgi:transglutaminase-like putative cysteine protease